MTETPVPGVVYIVTEKRTSQGFPIGSRIVWDGGDLDSLIDYDTHEEKMAASFTNVEGTASWWVAWEIEAVLENPPPDINDINDIEQFLKEG